MLYGDPNGAAHKSSFAVPPIVSPAATIDITKLEADMASTGLTLLGSTAAVKLAFKGQLKIVATVPIFGKLSAEIVINPSNLLTTLKDALGKALDDADVTTSLVDGLTIMYNAKDPKPTQWTMDATSLELSTAAFRFNVSRTTP